MPTTATGARPTMSRPVAGRGQANAREPDRVCWESRVATTSDLFRRVAKKAEDVVAGGRGRLKVVALLSGVLALAAADQGALPAVSTQLEQAFSIGNTQFGLLLSVVPFAGAVGTLPMGVLVDRARRKTLLIAAIAVWAVAMVLSSTANSYVYLLLTRILLGVVTAAAWPCVASLTGDFFPARERARMYGLIIGGELVGSGVGFFISGEVASFGNWRWSFDAMAALSLLPLFAIWRFLPEPERGAQKWLGDDATDPNAASQSDAEDTGASSSSDRPGDAREIVRKRGVEPREDLILHEDPTRRSWLWAIRYCLRIPTYRLLVIASALAYYFFSGARAFGMIYFTGHFGLPSGAVSALIIIPGLGALAGMIGGGRLSERLLERGRLNARVVLPAVALIASVPFLGLGVWATSAWLGLLFFTLGILIVAAAIAPIDAARLDIVVPQLWGRAEAGRMALRSAFEGSAPPLFGLLSGWLGGGNPVQGLEWTFLLMLAPMIAASLFVFPARKTYPRDLATAAASASASGEQNRRPKA